jgi:hypothetical protein
MRNIQEIFDRIQEKKREMREMTASMRDALHNMPEYQEVLEEMDKVKTKKKQIENSIKGESMASAVKMDTLKLGIKADIETLSDIALNNLVKGEPVKVTDENQNSYDPIFTVRFQKTK